MPPTLQVFSASNVELVTKTRVEHLPEADKEKCKKNNKTPIESFLGVAEEHSKTTGSFNGVRSLVPINGLMKIIVHLFMHRFILCSFMFVMKAILPVKN